MYNYYIVYYRLPLLYSGTSSALSAKHLSSDLPITAFGSAWPITPYSDLLTNPYSDLPIAAYGAGLIVLYSGLLTNLYSGLLIALYSDISIGRLALLAKYSSIN